MANDITRAAVDAGEHLLSILRKHIDVVASGADGREAEAEELDTRLWEAVADYGDALDELYGDDEEPQEDQDELTFTVRTRYDYTVVDEKALLGSGQGIGAAVTALIHKAGRPIGALEIDALETGSGLVTVHLNGEPLHTEDFSTAAEPTDLLLVAPNERLASVLDEPVFESRADAEAAAKRSSGQR